jgi:hypothetical protein
MSAAAKNFKAISEAKVRHNETCLYPPHTVLMHPHDIERLGWEEGDSIAGLELKADDSRQLDTFWLLCDRPITTPPEHQDVKAKGRERELQPA